MDPLVEMKHMNVRIALANKEFGRDRASEILDRAKKFSESSGIQKLHCFELGIQFEEEFEGKSLDMFDQAERWANRTAEEVHPNNPTLWLKALMFVLSNQRRGRADLN